MVKPPNHRTQITKSINKFKDKIEVPDKVLEDLLRRCTPWPWTITLKDNGDWAMLPNSESYHSYVCDKLPEINNYDRRLWGMAPALAAEVLYLRKLLAEKS